MADPFTHRKQFANFMFDLDPDQKGSGFTGVPTTNYLGIFLDGEVDAANLQPSGDPDAPTWFLTWDLSTPDTIATFADGARGQRYEIVFDLFADSPKANGLLVNVGPQIVSALAALSETNWTFLRYNPAPGGAVERIGGMEARGFTLEAIAS